MYMYLAHSQFYPLQNGGENGLKLGRKRGPNSGSEFRARRGAAHQQVLVSGWAGLGWGEV